MSDAVNDFPPCRGFTALVNMRLIHQDDIRTDLCLVMKGGQISAIFPFTDLPTFQEKCNLVNSPVHVMDCNQHFVSPGFIDLQVYGSGGLLFGTYPKVSTLQQMEKDMLSQGTTGFLTTMATNTLDIFEEGFKAARDHLQAMGERGACWGLHLEGPYLSPAKRGAHPLELIRAAREEEVAWLLLQAGGTLRMMTIAPELVSPAVRALLLAESVVLSSGHSNASLEEGRLFLAPASRSAEGGGVAAVTHLYNAMPPMFHRPGGVGYIPAIFEHRPYTSVIADGIHVDFAMLKLAKRELQDRLFLITDAVTETSEGVYQHQLVEEKRMCPAAAAGGGGGDEAEVVRKYVMPDGTLSGSALTMLAAVRNCVRHCDISLCEAVRMASLYPARLLGSTVSSRKGLLEAGFDADLCIFDETYRVVSTYKHGELVYHRSHPSEL